MTDAEKSQLDRFKEAARELETDDDEARFEAKLGKMELAKPRICKRCGFEVKPSPEGWDFSGLHDVCLSEDRDSNTLACADLERALSK